METKRAKIVKIIHIPLYQRQAAVVERIQEKESLSGKIRELISLYGDEKYPETPAYAEAMKMRAEAKKKELEKKIEFQELDPKVYCVETLGGKVSKDGTSCCFVPLSGNVKRVPLGEIKEWKITDGYPKVNNEIVNKTYMMQNEQPIDEETWKYLMERLNEA